MSTWDNLPHLTSDRPGIGGIVKKYDEDFFVEELPLYEAGGSGTHTYFTIEKQGLPTLAAIRMIARALGRKRQDIGYAGMKDAHGITRQRLSLEHVKVEKLESLQLDKIKVIRIERHSNKIKLGHLSGNRFRVRIRDVGRAQLADAEATLASLSGRGVPNYFGPQRFGSRGDNPEVGMAVIRGDLAEAISIMLGRPGDGDRADVRRARELFESGDYEASAKAWPPSFAAQARLCDAYASSGGNAGHAWRSVDHTMRKFYISSVQSRFFNLVLAHRIAAMDKLEVGDVAWKHANGSCFSVEDLAAEQPRCDAFEISPSGPLFGKKMKQATGHPGEIEVEVLAQAGYTPEQMHGAPGLKIDGARRPLRVPLRNSLILAERDEHGTFIEVCFDLPPGAYATNVTREICKGLGSYHRLIG
ncbi:MAG: tRNA pseudouridine(13) synthase TruD [Planctomycetota bacterium]|jgi:tRNA pseudouridine13 synthase